MPRSASGSDNLAEPAVRTCRLERDLAEHLADHGDSDQRSSSRAIRTWHLPPDAVEVLARDEDRVVQLLLADSCDDAPEDMLLRVWQSWAGSLSVPIAPTATRTSPVPTCSATPMIPIRGCANRPWTKRNVTPARHAAARHPGLPARVLVRLLRDTGTAQSAARHPAMPLPVMEQMHQRNQPPTDTTPGL